jgi:hypothetical protein
MRKGLWALVGFLLAQARGSSQSWAADVYEAGKAQLLNGANIQATKAASGGAMVGFLGGEKGGAVVFEDVNVKRGGPYTLAVRYATGDTRTLRVTVNGDQRVRVLCAATKGWFEFAVKEVEITLNPGKNTIRLDNSPAWAPNIDSIAISPSSFWRLSRVLLWSGLVCFLGGTAAIAGFLVRRRRPIADSGSLQ